MLEKVDLPLARNDIERQGAGPPTFFLEMTASVGLSSFVIELFFIVLSQAAIT